MTHLHPAPTTRSLRSELRRVASRLRHLKQRRASALMLVIWAVMMMAFTVAGVVTYMKSSLKVAAQTNADFQALHMAECGLGLAMNPVMSTALEMHWVPNEDGTDGEFVNVDATNRDTVGGGSGFYVNKTREGIAFPINFVTDDKARESVYNLFVLWGVDASDASTAADSLVDWVDSDSEAKPQGAEKEYYESQGVYGLPANQSFTSLDEMLLVRGFDAVAKAKPDWRNYFSLYGNGLIDLAYASKDVIMAVTGASDSDAQRYVTFRAGDDGINGTSDDNKNNNLGTALQQLSIPPEKLDSVRNLVTYRDNSVFHIKSVGWVGTKKLTIVVIANYSADDGSLKYQARYEE